MRHPDREDIDLPVELELEPKEVEKVERERTPRPFVLVEGRKFPNTDALQTQRFGPR